MQITVKKLLAGFGCLLLVIYLGVVCVWANWRANEELCRGLEEDKVHVDDRHKSGFVTSDELTYEIQPLLGDLTAKKLSEVDFDSIQRYLAGLDKIESAEVMRLSDHHIRIRVVPMVPVARVWPSTGHSYYVNRNGKRIRASSRYRLDVPQISGNYSPTALLPLLEFMKRDTDAGDFITMISAADTTNIILVPAMRGHVINIGDARNLEDKFHRLRRFYGEVLPVKGYTFYDTISVKWDHQVVATRRNNKLPDLSVPIIEELEHEQADPGIDPIKPQKPNA